MHRIVLSALLLLLLTASPALADNARGLVAVLELKNKLHGSEKEQVDEAYLTDLVRSQVLEQGRGLRVMTRENIVVLLQSQGKKLADCEGECEVDTGRRLGADYIISGEVLKFGTALKVNLKLHETHDGQLLAGAQASGTTVDELDHNTAASVGRLLAPLRGEAPGAEPVAERPSAPSPAPVPASPARPTTPPADSAAEQRAAEQRKAEQRTAEQRAAQQRAVEQRAVAQRPPEPAPQSKPQAADASARPASESAGQAGLELRVAPFLASASTFSLEGVGVRRAPGLLRRLELAGRRGGRGGRHPRGLQRNLYLRRKQHQPRSDHAAAGPGAKTEPRRRGGHGAIAKQRACQPGRGAPALACREPNHRSLSAASIGSIDPRMRA